tara:strand:+ start:359 stop:553 length:195 start_codon:yes stop_codon:yes gene_type:complete
VWQFSLIDDLYGAVLYFFEPNSPVGLSVSIPKKENRKQKTPEAKQELIPSGSWAFYRVRELSNL